MKFTIVPKSFLFIIWISLYASTLVGQTAGQCMELARKQIELKNYQAAIDLYERVLFFDRSELRYKAIRDMATSYSLSGNFDKAVQLMEQARNLAPDDSLRNDAVFALARYYILSGNPQFALIELYSLNELNDHKDLSRKLYLLTAANFKAGLYDEAQRNALRYLRMNDADTSRTVVLIQKARTINSAMPNLAAISSLIIPGSGQAMSGNFASALNSFLLITSFDVLYVYISLKYSWFDAFFTIFPWVQRYYTGGFMAARELMKEKQEQRKQEIFNELLAELYKASKAPG